MRCRQGLPLSTYHAQQQQRPTRTTVQNSDTHKSRDGPYAGARQEALRDRDILSNRRISCRLAGGRRIGSCSSARTSLRHRGEVSGTRLDAKYRQARPCDRDMSCMEPWQVSATARQDHFCGASSYRAIVQVIFSTRRRMPVPKSLQEGSNQCVPNTGRIS